ncbi:MAG: Ribosomal protein L44E [Candidatus Alkanophagales archaeon MCA70_species_1]|nr:Ribosomal protein L44E [Candidatus Alkanophaga volatiphilum]
MKMPKKIRTFCPYCKKHSIHEVEKVKKGKASSLSWIARQKKRKKARIGNSGKFSKVPGGDKPTKKVFLRYTCTECKKSHTREGFRVSRFELVEM